jgi:hypothetical protein
LATVPALAVRVTVSVALTEETVAVKLAVVVPDATVTEAGTVTAELLLARFTTNPPLAAAAFRVIVQLSVPAAVIDPLVQLSALNAGSPRPVRVITVEVPVEELLFRISEPVAAPAVVGSNCTVSVAVWLGFKVNGNVAPETLNPAPLMVAALTVTADVPVELKVTVWVTGVLRDTPPKPMLVTLTPSVGTLEPSCRLTVLATLPAPAVNVTDCVVLTEVIVAVKPALVAPDGTVTEAGTVTELLLLATLTTSPPLAAAAFSVTVQLSVPAAVIAPLAQLNALSTGTPVPLKLIVFELPVDELLVKTSVPLLVPAAVGSNCTVSVAV